MGSHLHIYLGPYVEGSYRDESKEVDVTGCTNSKCPEYAKRGGWARPSGKFCSTCASPIGTSKKIEKVHPSPYDVMGERDELTPMGHDSTYKSIWLGSNINGPRDFHPKDDCVRDLTTLDREGEMRWLSDTFAEDITRLKTAYDNVTVKWGLLMYHM
jgi:hypothetical protein